MKLHGFPMIVAKEWETVRFYRWATLLLVGLLVFTGCVSRTPQSIDKQSLEAALEASLNGAVRNADGVIARNALLAIDAPTVGFTYAGAAGVYRVDSNEPMTVDRQFIIASVAKAMTAVIIHQLAEEGAFGDKGMDATLAELAVLPPEVLAELHLIDGVSYAHEITLRHLLNHTSGLRDVYFDGVANPVGFMPGTAEGAAPDSLVGMAAFDEQIGLVPLVDCTLNGLPPGCNPDDYLFRHPWIPWNYQAWQANPQDKMAGLLNFYLTGMNQHALWQPGKGFHYSDTNYILLGLTIEKLTSHSLHQELRARIFDPLGMKDTYLIGATDPPAEAYEKQLAEVWAWGEPAISGGVDFSFDWGGGVVSTLNDLHTFTRALISGRLFQQADTLDQMLTVPPDVEGISYASGLIVFPTDQGPVIYMMGSNGAWVEFYPPLDLVMIGNTNDFSNMPKQFMLHGEIYRILADHGLNTPMARLTSLPMLLVMFCLVFLLILPAIWLIGTLQGKRKGISTTSSVKLAKWLTAAAFLLNLVMMALIGVTFSDNPFQMLFGFSPQVRSLLGLTGLLMGIFSLVMTVSAVRLWRRKEDKAFDRGIFTALVVTTLVYAAAMGVLGL